MNGENEVFDDEFEVHGSTDQPVSDLLEKGRYPFEVSEIESHLSTAGNKCAVVRLRVAGRNIKDYLILEGKMEFRWRQFLFAIGIRDKATYFKVPKAKIVGGKGLVDIGIKTDRNGFEVNVVRSYSPVAEEVAPLKDVPPEEAPPETPAEDDDEL